MASRQDYFTLLSHGKQVDGTEEKVLHRESPHHLQAQRFSNKQSEWGSNLLKYSSEDQLIISLDMATTYITFECSFISLDISVRVILQLYSAVFFDRACLPLHNSRALFCRIRQRSTSIAMAQSKRKWHNLGTTESNKAFKYLHFHLSKFKTHL